MEFQKRITEETSIELLFYRTINCTCMFSPRLEGDLLIFPMGEKMPNKVYTDMEIDKVMEMVLSFLLFCEKNGIIYGDVKLENIVMYQGDIKMIDFDIFYFRNLNYTIRTQTYPSIAEKSIRKKSWVTLGNYYEDLCFAIGFLLIEMKYPNKKIVDVYNNISRGNYDAFKLGKWNSFLNVSLNSQNSVRDLIKHAPIKITSCHGSVKYHPTPGVPDIWDPHYEEELNKWIPALVQGGLLEQGVPISVELYKRYLNVIPNPEDMKEDIFRCCLFAATSYLTMVLMDRALGIATLAFQLYGETETMCTHEELLVNIKRVRLLYMEFIEYRFPSLFRDGII